VEFPSNGERAKARRGGNLYPCTSRERRITHPNSDANARTDVSVPKARLVRRWVAAATLHPYARPNGAAGERLTEPIGDDGADADPDSRADADPDSRADADPDSRADADPDSRADADPDAAPLRL
jgi:hypothetical protein